MVDNVIPFEKISTVREEVELAGALIEGNLKAIRDYIGTNGGEEEKRSLLQSAQKEKLELRAITGKVFQLERFEMMSSDNPSAK